MTAIPRKARVKKPAASVEGFTVFSEVKRSLGADFQGQIAYPDHESLPVPVEEE